MTSKAERLSKLRAETLRCAACSLADSRTQVVFGNGNPDAEILLVGEAPGETEDQEGRPFVGDSGRMLNTILEKAGLKRSELFITNAVRCRPVSPLGTNRMPTKSEVLTCQAWLYRIIYLLDPVVIIAAGAVPTRALTSAYRTLKDAAKEMYDVEIPGVNTPIRYPVVSIHHPSSLLRRAHNFDLMEATVDQLIHVRRTLEAFRRLGRGQTVPERPEAEEKKR